MHSYKFNTEVIKKIHISNKLIVDFIINTYILNKLILFL